MAVIGAGSWGTALAVHLARAGHDVRLWGRDAALVAAMAADKTNTTYLSGVVFPDAVRPEVNLAVALTGAEMVVMAVPSHGLRTIVRLAAPAITAGTLIVSATKGLEEGSLLRMSEVLREELPSGGAPVVLTGPSFAAEVARGLPTALVVASESAASVEQVQVEFRSSAMRLYGSADVVGAELGGSLKNVIAIAAGVVQGLGLGHNALAGLITRGLAEIARLASALGAQRETLAGLAGLGDLVLTCTGHLSRNRRLGVELSLGRALGDVLGDTPMVAEGVRTTYAALALGSRVGVELPITAQMAEVLAGCKTPLVALEELMGRRQKAEGA